MENRYTLGDNVWIKETDKGQFNIPRGCKIVGLDGKTVQVRNDDGKVVSIQSDQIVKRMHPSSVSGVEDMIKLGGLQEYVILNYQPLE